MTENTGSVQGQDIDASQSLPTITSSPAVENSQSVATEKLFKQSEVNEIVGRAKHEAVERHKRAVENTSPAMSEAEKMQLSRDELDRMIAEKVSRLKQEESENAQRIAYEQKAKGIATDFLTKLSVGTEKYPDLEKLMSDIDLRAYPQAVHLSTMVDNTSDVFYELVKDPLKLHQINELAKTSSQAALRKINELSQAIKDNEAASKVKLPNEPLGHMRPSNTGTDSGDRSISDYKLLHKRRR